MTKKQLVQDLSCMAGNVPHSIVASVLEALTQRTRQALSEGQEMAIPGIGKLTTTTRSARAGRNPKTGEPVDIPPSRGIKFKPSSSLKTAI
jgi:DNA-binding protein HU-beta